ncbi:MAG: alkaline phosphatase [Gloeobacterales cyanobacterium]
MKKFVRLHKGLAFATTIGLSYLIVGCHNAFAGADDDTQKANIAPVLGTPPFSDNPTNASPTVGLRIFPPTHTQLIENQRFDLRIETQVPGNTPPVLKSLKINGTEIRDAFNKKIEQQGKGLESGTATLPNLYGATARNRTFTKAGTYTVEAVVTVDGTDYSIRNVYSVAKFALSPKVKHVVFFLGDAMGLPIRTAARIYSKGIFEGRAKGRLNMDKMSTYGLVSTSSLDSTITDSAPGMASYATGMKQANNALNVSPDNTPENGLDNPRIETLWEYLKRRQRWATGVVTDAFLTDATPAAVAAHSRARSNRTAIAQQFLDFYKDGTAQPSTGYAALKDLTQPLDVMLGGAAQDWLPIGDEALSNFYQASNTQGRTDGLNLFKVARDQGYAVVKDKNELASAPANKPLLGIFAGDFRPDNALGADNIPGVLDRLVARGEAKIGGKDASAVGMGASPPVGTACGSTTQQCFQNIPSKKEMLQKAIQVLNAKNPEGWILLVEQSQTDKLAHPLEYERVVYEALELDGALGLVLNGQAKDGKTLTVVTADHAQPESIIGVTIPSAINGSTGAPIAPGGCFNNSSSADASKGSLTLSPCALQDAIGTFNDSPFPTYVDANKDGFPDDPDPTVKLILDDAGRPTYSQDYLTNAIPLNPSGKTAAIPNPKRDPQGLLLTGNMPTRNVSPISKDEGNIAIAPHAGDDVVLSASGPGNNLFGGTFENSDTFERLAAALSGGGRKEDEDERPGLFSPKEFMDTEKP